MYRVYQECDSHDTEKLICSLYSRFPFSPVTMFSRIDAGVCGAGDVNAATVTIVGQKILDGMLS